MRKLILLSIILILIGGNAFASETAYSADPSLAGYGARPLGMGGAFAAMADDTNAIFSNPAGLSSLQEWSVTSMSTQLLQKVDYKLLGGAYKFGPGNLGVGYIGTSAPAGYKFSEYGTLESSSQMSYETHTVLLSYGVSLANMMRVDKSMGNISIGGTIKAISKGTGDIDNATASGFGLDLGIMSKSETSPYSYGMALKNIGGTVKWSSGTIENLEGTTNLGFSAKLIGENGLNKETPGELTAGIDFELFNDGKPLAIHIGTEYFFSDYFAVRLGIEQEPISLSETVSNLTAGVGVAYDGFKFDYAYKANAEIQELSSHYFSISYSLPEKAEKTAKKQKEKLAEEESIIETQKDVKSTDNIYDLPDEYKNITY